MGKETDLAKVVPVDPEQLANAGEDSTTPSSVKRTVSNVSSFDSSGFFSHRNCRYISRRVVDAVPFQLVVVTLTLYALFGDGVRLLATTKASDPVFTVLTIISLLVFSIEIVLQSIGKSDYFLSFFFWLDILSTVSLIFDIPEVNEELFAESGDEEGNALRAGRAGRAGTRASRVVRLIRLVRIAKVYHQMRMQRARRIAKARMQQQGLADDSFLLDDDDEEESVVDSTAVGKKLTELTTRRLIILILVLLLTLPNLDPASLTEQPSSGHYGADRVYTSLLRSLKDGGVNKTFERSKYEEQLLTFIHYHNWYSEMPEPYPEACNGCSGAFDYDNGLFWIGFMGEERDIMAEKAYLKDTDPNAWFKQNSGLVYRLDPLMPDEALAALGKPWKRSCEISIIGWMSGISLLEREGLLCPDELRHNERQLIMPNLGDPNVRDHRMIFIMDKRDFSHQEATLDILKIFFIVVILALGSMMFHKDSNKLVLRPLEQMIDKVEKIRSNPLHATKLGDMEFKQEEIMKLRAESGMMATKTSIFGRLKDMMWKPKKKAVSNATPLETVVLEKTIIKLGTLLALGYGQAGANIIGQNMKGSDTAGVNAMVPGNRVNCVLGYVTLQDFNVLTEVLQGGVMTFVNSVSEIIHGIVQDFHGAPNKNSGDTFLLIWRSQEVPEQTARMLRAKSQAAVTNDGTAGSRRLSAIKPQPKPKKKSQEAEEVDETRLCEMSLISMVKILAAVQRSPVLAEYRRHPALLQRIQKYQVSLACALHHGWAIEGAIGSEFKIDASYVSPNVNILMRIGEATQHYGVKVVVTEAVVELMGTAIQRHLRHIDRVLVPGSKDPISLHTVDLDLSVLTLEEPLQMEGMQWNPRRRFKARQAFEASKQMKLKEGMSMALLLENNPEFVAMRKKFTESFSQTFRMAFFNYIAGEWKIALNMLSQTYDNDGLPDGPSMALIEYMQIHQGQCPPDWIGLRPLSFMRPIVDKAQLSDHLKESRSSRQLVPVKPPAKKNPNGSKGTSISEEEVLI